MANQEKEWIRIQKPFDLRIARLKRRIEQIEQEKIEALKLLTQECIESGGHYPDGGFMYDNCLKCGEFLG